MPYYVPHITVVLDDLLNELNGMREENITMVSISFPPRPLDAPKPFVRIEGKTSAHDGVTRVAQPLVVEIHSVKEEEDIFIDEHRRLSNANVK